MPKNLSSISPFARHAQRFIDNSLPVIPIAPGTKKPGEFVNHQWRGMKDWTRYSRYMPTNQELDRWHSWPDAGIGLLCGVLAGVVAVDVDTEDESILIEIAKILPPSPVRKKGKKGYTSFYRYNKETSRSWRRGGETILDLLSDGRQTLMPGSVHPEGMTYISITEDTLEDFDLNQLPVLPHDFVARMNKLAEAFQLGNDGNDDPGTVSLMADHDEDVVPQSFAAAYFRDINNEALLRLDEWVPKMIPTATRSSDGYRCKAFWRGGDGLNVGINPKGMMDFAGGYGMTAIDLVMHAHSTSVNNAAETLRSVLDIPMVAEPYLFGKRREELALNDTAPPVARSDGKPKREEIVDLSEVQTALMSNSEQSPVAQGFIADSVPAVIHHVPGILGRIVDWMTRTAPKYQPELFVAAAIILGATVMGRLFRTRFGNWPSLYVVMVAKSGEGKEHPMQCVKQILEAAGAGHLLAGSGYTSPGAVFSALKRAPSHLAIIDEMGKMLKISRAKGNHHSEAAIDKLVEAYGAGDSIMKPPEYSTMTMNQSQLMEMEDRTVHNPAISLLGATTPSTFYDALTPDLVKDGFLGRVITVISRQPSQVGKLMCKTSPPEDIVMWARCIHDKARSAPTYMNPGLEAHPTEMSFDDEALTLFERLEEDLTMTWKPKFESDDLAVLLSRTREKAMRLSMIVAKSTNRLDDNVIHKEAAQWAIAYIAHYDLQLAHVVQSQVGQSPLEKDLKRAVDFVARAKTMADDKEYGKILALGAMPATKLHRAMKWDTQRFKVVMDAAVGQGLVTKAEPFPAGGFAGAVYWLRSLDV